MSAYPGRVQPASEQFTIEAIRPKVSDALVQLKANHRLIEDQFESYSRLAPFAKKQDCLYDLVSSVTIHLTLLTFYFYPAIMDILEDSSEFARKSIVKYAQFKALLSELEDLSPVTELHDEKIAELKILFQQHVKDEETVIFPKVRKSQLNVVELGETLHRARQRLESDLHIKVKKAAGQIAVKSPVRQHRAALLRH